MQRCKLNNLMQKLKSIYPSTTASFLTGAVRACVRACVRARARKRRCASRRRVGRAARSAVCFLAFQPANETERPCPFAGAGCTALVSSHTFARHVGAECAHALVRCRCTVDFLVGSHANQDMFRDLCKRGIGCACGARTATASVT